MGGGIGIGMELTNARADARIQTETHYYMQAVDQGYQTSPLSQEETLELLRWMQYTHQQWVDNPQWYGYSGARRQREIALVISYGRIINYIMLEQLKE